MRERVAALDEDQRQLLREALAEVGYRRPPPSHAMRSGGGACSRGRRRCARPQTDRRAVQRTATNEWISSGAAVRRSPRRVLSNTGPARGEARALCGFPYPRRSVDCMSERTRLTDRSGVSVFPSVAIAPQGLARSPTSSLGSPSVVLFLALFASQTGVLTLAPILSDVAADFDISIAQAGQLRILAAPLAALVAIAAGRSLVRFSPRALLGVGSALLAAEPSCKPEVTVPSRKGRNVSIEKCPAPEDGCFRRISHFGQVVVRSTREDPAAHPKRCLFVPVLPDSGMHRTQEVAGSSPASLPPLSSSGLSVRGRTGIRSCGRGNGRRTGSSQEREEPLARTTGSMRSRAPGR